MHPLIRILVGGVLLVAACGSSSTPIEADDTAPSPTGSTDGQEEEVEKESEAGDDEEGVTATTKQAEPTSKQDQELTWGDVGPWTFGQVKAATVSASSGLTVTLATQGSCSVEQQNLQTVKATGAGDCTITASQAGSGEWREVSETRTYEIDKAKASLVSFAGTFEYDADPDCLIDPGPSCARHTLVAESQVPVTFALGDGADQFCELDGDRFTYTNNAVLPRTCPVVVSGKETATHLGFQETREAVMNPFTVELTASVTPAPPDYLINITSNYRATMQGCTQSSVTSIGSSRLTITQEQVTDDGCSFQVRTVDGDASKTRECRQIDLPAAVLVPCTTPR